ncbi:hypothetical protein MSG28_000113 [Choristoneura fumiferana]|uniref:Uncharacterized protein n=1 Tax=Choristoneura fumiferana TaxID=7141 RepID=A0ACC0JZ68_CHOFU|nr:hypothetical protein MSG28_000113 [Choristoneura fumiferana]
MYALAARDINQLELADMVDGQTRDAKRVYKKTSIDGFAAHRSMPPRAIALLALGLLFPFEIIEIHISTGTNKQRAYNMKNAPPYMARATPILMRMEPTALVVFGGRLKAYHDTSMLAGEEADLKIPMISEV